MTLTVGEAAPSFTLSDQFGAQVSLAELHSEGPVVLVFFPFAFSGICTGELCEIRDNIAAFKADNVQVVGISCDPKYALKAWGEAEGYDFPLLSDFWPHGAVAQQYGVFLDQMGFSGRGSFLIDQQGVLRWQLVNGPGEARPLAAYQEAIAAL